MCVCVFHSKEIRQKYVVGWLMRSVNTAVGEKTKALALHLKLLAILVICSFWINCLSVSSDHSRAYIQLHSTCVIRFNTFRFTAGWVLMAPQCLVLSHITITSNLCTKWWCQRSALFKICGLCLKVRSFKEALKYPNTVVSVACWWLQKASDHRHLTKY